MSAQLATCALLVVQIVLTIALAVQGACARPRARFRDHARRSTHAARFTLAGELTASIGDATAEPLSAMLENVETAELLLGDADANAAALANLLSEIKHDNLRASRIVRHWLDVARHERDPKARCTARD